MGNCGEERALGGSVESHVNGCAVKRPGLAQRHRSLPGSMPPSARHGSAPARADKEGWVAAQLPEVNFVMCI